MSGYSRLRRQAQYSSGFSDRLEASSKLAETSGVAKQAYGLSEVEWACTELHLLWGVAKRVQSTIAG